MRSGSPTRKTLARPVREARPSAPDDPARARRLQALLRDLGSDLQQGPGAGAEDTAPCPTGLPDLDHLLGGGLPRGRLCEWVGPSSSGRTSLALSLLAATTQQGHCVGWIDAADAFDPISADAAGAVLERVLWVRPPSLREALRCSERLLETEGFPLIVLDLAAGADRIEPARDPACWLRLSKRAAGTRSALLLLGSERSAGSSAHLALELRPARARWSEGLVLLEQLEIEVVLARHRTAPAGRCIRVAAPGSRAA